MGIRLICELQGRKTNISPSLSPGGKYLMFISGKNVFSHDLFLADAHTGQIIRQVAGSTRDAHLDALSFLESAGSWSPDNRYYAFAGQDMGKYQLVIKEVRTGKTVDAFFPEIPR